MSLIMLFNLHKKTQLDLHTNIAGDPHQILTEFSDKDGLQIKKYTMGKT